MQLSDTCWQTPSRARGSTMHEVYELARLAPSRTPISWLRRPRDVCAMGPPGAAGSPSRRRSSSRLRSCAGTRADTAPSLTPRCPASARIMTIDEVLEIARAGRRPDAREALFTLGDKPERKWTEARDELAGDGLRDHDRVPREAACAAAREQTSLLPHANPGALYRRGSSRSSSGHRQPGDDARDLSERLLQARDGALRSPGQETEVRLETLEAAGKAAVPFTTGILIGIGETFEERIDALIAIRASHERHGHIQEVIVQNFRAKPNTLDGRSSRTRRGRHAGRRLRLHDSYCRPDVAVQAPPNLTPDRVRDAISTRD